MIDTHCHPYLPEFEDGGTEAVRRALDAGVGRMVFPNVDMTTIEPMKRLHDLFPGSTAMAMGLHPTEVGSGWNEIVDQMECELRQGGYVAVGEVGIDLYWDKNHREEQMEAFTRQLRIADELRLPVIIHCRDGLDETLECIRSANPHSRIVFHSFTGGPDDVRKIRAVADAMFGINGVVTYKSAAGLREALPLIGLDRLLLETDSPYLTPVPHRGKRNEPAYVCHIRNKIAETLSISSHEVEEATDRNAKQTFCL